MCVKLKYQKRQTGKTYKLIGKALKYDCSHRKVLYITTPISYDNVVERLRYHKIGHTIDIQHWDSLGLNENLVNYDLVLLDEFDFIDSARLNVITQALAERGIKTYGLSTKNYYRTIGDVIKTRTQPREKKITLK